MAGSMGVLRMVYMGVNAVVEGGDGEIRRGQGFWPPKPNTEYAACSTGMQSKLIAGGAMGAYEVYDAYVVVEDYESLIAKLRLILFTWGSEWNSDPNASVVYPGKAFYLLCDCIL